MYIPAADAAASGGGVRARLQESGVKAFPTD